MLDELLLRVATQAPFVIIFVLVLFEAVRRPYRVNFDIVLFFGATATAVVVGWLADARLPERPVPVAFVTTALAVAMPYLLLRVVNAFADVPAWLHRGALAGLVLLVASAAVLPPPRPLEWTLVAVAYFFALIVYAAARFADRARTSTGVTRRRMDAGAVGSVLLGVVIVLAGAEAAAPAWPAALQAVQPLGALAAGIAYLLAFAPPTFLRRAWQEPELRAFLGRVAGLPRLPDRATILRTVEEGAAASLGAERATVMIWDQADGVLRAPTLTESGRGTVVRPGQYIVGRAFAAQRPVFVPDAPADDPEHAEVYRRWNALAVMVAPISVGDRRLGTLAIYSPRPPIFAHDDLDLAVLIAQQAAVVLESRRLLEQAAEVRAREEATRLKDDFLSAAAHDLKTPVASVLAYSQLLERRARAEPDRPPDLKTIQRLVGEADRLRVLVTNLLDVSAGEDGQLAGNREPVALNGLAREVCERRQTKRHPCVPEDGAPVVVHGDHARLTQLTENLVENAMKYSPAGGEVRVRVWTEGPDARLAVTDRGIGIPEQELPHVFERFRRAADLDDRRFAGMGLGLYLCRLIAEQHGGRIWAESRVGEGSTFHVALPRASGGAESD